MRKARSQARTARIDARRGEDDSRGAPSAARRHAQLAALLVGSLPAEQQFNQKEWEEFLVLARAERVSPLLHRCLTDRHVGGVPEAVRQQLALDYQAAAWRALLLRALRKRVCARLRERGIRVLLLKGAALMLTCYDDPATRVMADLDLLVPASQREEAARVLEEQSFHPLSGSRATELQSERGHLAYVDATHETKIEVHWELQLLGRMRTKATAEIWANARPVDTAATASVMRLGHTLPLLCAHMLLQHREPRLLWLHDIHRVLLNMQDAEAALAREAAARWGLAPCTILGLNSVRLLFGTELPQILSLWSQAEGGSRNLQTRVVAQALARRGEAPSEYLMALLMNRNYPVWRILFPTPDDLRRRLQIAAADRVWPGAYAKFLTRRLCTSPVHLRQLWRFWRSSTRLLAPDSSPGALDEDAEV